MKIAARLAVLTGLLLLAGANIASAQPLLPEGGVKTDKKKLTPEERAAIKAQKAAKEEAMLELRRQNFGQLPEGDDSPLAKEYQEAFVNFRTAVADVSDVYKRHQYRKDNEVSLMETIGKDWVDNLAIAHKRTAIWKDKAAELYAADPDKYVALGETLRELLLEDADADRLDGNLASAKALVRAGRLDSDEILQKAGLVAFANSDFDFAVECWTRLNDKSQLGAAGVAALKEINETKTKWERELEFRKRDEAKGDNPLVELVTTKGRLVIELFEDDAPEAVNNFIYLVERGYFKRKPFFRVVQHLVAQTGCEKGDGTGSPGYMISGEAHLPNHRDHFRGSLAFALSVNPANGQTDPNSGGAQFYISVLPAKHLDGQHTVFARVVEGIETLGLLRVMDLSKEDERKDTSNRPDVLISATVLRKRDHEYRPDPVAGKLPR